ncbi:MAG: Rne/Rng family ribonuclease [Rhodothermales bacterium]|nr:Rne/Rng family ribonuclease [Rhodothermales bacterium]MBO6779527.1 Rne/Rng family ribonuclease [Rhodothermales bacterium]
MSKELVINSDGQTTRIAIVEGGDLAELFIETEEHERTIGNLFVGRIRRVMPSIQAAFVDIGQKQDAFLHFSDLSESIPDWLEYVKSDKPEIARFASGSAKQSKGGKRRKPVSARRRKRLEDGAEDPEAELALEQEDDQQKRGVVGLRGRHRRKAGQKVQAEQRGRSGRRGGGQSQEHDDGVPPESFLQRDQPILVKISKEPIAQKGSRVTTDISLAGRFLVLVPMANYVAVSKKVSSFKERRRLRALAKMLLPDGFGVIVRTQAEGQNAKALDTDLRLLREKWTEIEKRLAEKPKPPVAVYEDVNMVSSIMRDLFSVDFDRILIDEQRMYRNIKGYVQAVAPDMGAKVRFHDKKTPVFKTVGIDRAVAEAFESRVNLPSGGYLYIEQTEAMHVVDVNSGRAGKGLSQEENSLKVNIEAAKVIARQIRLRDLGGILVIDFIDMRSERSRRKVYEQMRREFRKDRAVTKVLPMSDFGLMQITRQRLRPSITHTFSDLHEESVADIDAKAASSGIREARERPRVVEPSEVIGRIEDWLEAFGNARWKGAIRLKVHPFTAAYLSKGLFGFWLPCLFRYRMRVVLEGSPGMDPGRFRFYDETNGKEIRRPPRRGRKKREEVGRGKGTQRKDGQAASTEAEDAPQARDAQAPAEATSGRGSEQRNERRGRGKRSEDTPQSDGRARRGGSGRNQDQQSRRAQKARGDADSKSESSKSDSESGKSSRSNRSRSEAQKPRRESKPRSSARAEKAAGAKAAVVSDGESSTAAEVSSNGSESAEAKPKTRSRRSSTSRRQTKTAQAEEASAEAVDKAMPKQDSAAPEARDSSLEIAESDLADTGDGAKSTKAGKAAGSRRKSRVKAEPEVKAERSSTEDTEHASGKNGSPEDEHSVEQPPTSVEAAQKTVQLNASDSAEKEAAGPAEASAEEKMPKVQPFKLRYSSSHQPAQSDQ